MFDEEKLEKALLDTAIREAFKGYDRSLTGKAAASECTNRLYDCLRKLAKEFGMDPIYEVFAWRPGQDRVQGSTCWGVSWEAGPFEWAIAASFVIMDLTGRLCEPHYSFDLCFYEVE
jgi:hypothetical protein